jgi:hypothetical protein
VRDEKKSVGDRALERMGEEYLLVEKGRKDKEKKCHD